MAQRKLNAASKAAVVALVVLVAALYFLRPDERFRSAWAFANPPLPGHWEGTIETATGDRFPIFLTLTYHEPNRHRRIGRSRAQHRGFGRFEGGAIVCDSPGSAATYNVDGAPRDRHAAQIAFFTEAAERHDGLTPGHFNAAWDGADAIRGSVQFSWREEKSAISGPDYPDTQADGQFSLHRTKAAVTREACARTKALANPSDLLLQSGRVTDAARILGDEGIRRLTTQLERLEKSSGGQIAVATVSDLGGQDIAVFARNLRVRWKLGHEHMDDGILVLVAPKERQARIAIGHGIQHRVPDAVSQKIMDEQMTPRFKSGDFAGGLEAGVASLAEHIR